MGNAPIWILLWLLQDLVVGDCAFDATKSVGQVEKIYTVEPNNEEQLMQAVYEIGPIAVSIFSERSMDVSICRAQVSLSN